jgi:hypothetical protein
MTALPNHKKQESRCSIGATAIQTRFMVFLFDQLDFDEVSFLSWTMAIVD